MSKKSFRYKPPNNSNNKSRRKIYGGNLKTKLEAAIQEALLNNLKVTINNQNQTVNLQKKYLKDMIKNAFAKVNLTVKNSDSNQPAKSQQKNIFSRIFEKFESKKKIDIAELKTELNSIPKDAPISKEFLKIVESVKSLFNKPKDIKPIFKTNQISPPVNANSKKIINNDEINKEKIINLALNQNKSIESTSKGNLPIDNEELTDVNIGQMAVATTGLVGVSALTILLDILYMTNS